MVSRFKEDSMRHGVSGQNARYMPQWASRCLLLGCFLVLLFGAIEQCHAPHFAAFHQADENLQSHPTQYSVASLPAKLRIRNESTKWLTDEALAESLALPISDELFPGATITLPPVILYHAVLARVVFCYSNSCRTILPPNRAPPHITVRYLTIA